MREFKILEVLVGSADYHRLLGLRFGELRRPLGMEWTVEEMEAEKGDRHFGLWADEDWVGTVVVSAGGVGVAKLRQIAVIRERQGEGLGRLLMEGIEEKMKLEGVEEVFLNARRTVAGFYESLGYVAEGGEFAEIGLPHVRMRKMLRRG